MSSAEQAMKTLTQQWYNAVTTGLGLSPDSFQLYQGSTSIPDTSQDMWNVMNVVPPEAINGYTDPSQGSLFSSVYNLILVSLQPSSDTDFRSCLGDYYTQWQEYYLKNFPEDFTAENVTRLYTRWASVYAPGKGGCVSSLTRIMNDPINLAQSKFEAASGQFAYNRDVDQLKRDIVNAPSKSFEMNSLTESSDIEHTWAKATIGVAYDLFSFNATGEYDELTEIATTAGINIRAEFAHATTFSLGPYAVFDANNPILNRYKVWYESAVMSLAYGDPSNRVWSPSGRLSWRTAFGENGACQRMATSLVCVDGVKITITSAAEYNESQQEEIQATVSAGVWPFFNVDGAGGYHNQVSFDDSGRMTITTEGSVGSPLILGILKSDTQDVFS